MAGYVIENVRAGLVEQHHWDAVAELPADGSVILLDVRTPGEVRKQGLLRSDALHIPWTSCGGGWVNWTKGRRFMSTATAACGAICLPHPVPAWLPVLQPVRRLALLVLQRHRPGPRCRADPPVRCPHWKGLKNSGCFPWKAAGFICYGRAAAAPGGAPAGRLPDRPADPTGRTRRRLIQQGGQLQKEAAGQQIPGGGRNGAYGGQPPQNEKKLHQGQQQGPGQKVAEIPARKRRSGPEAAGRNHSLLQA